MQVVWVACKQNGMALQFTSPELQEDYDIVWEAVNSCGKALMFASEALRCNFGIVMAAVKMDGKALLYASSALQVISSSASEYAARIASLGIYVPRT